MIYFKVFLAKGTGNSEAGSIAREAWIPGAIFRPVWNRFGPYPLQQIYSHSKSFDGKEVGFEDGSQQLYIIVFGRTL